VKFNLYDTHGKKIKGKSLSIALVSAYFPCNDANHEKFCEMLDSKLNAIKSNTTIVMSMDINARIGIRINIAHKKVIGTHGIPCSNLHGEHLLQTLAAHNLQVEKIFFQHRPEDYITYTSIPNSAYPQGISSMHDIFACSQSLHK
jgi:hypothetical protein